MRYLVCPICKGNVDPGELVGGICTDCADQEEKDEDTHRRVELMLVSRDFRQMELEGI